MANLQQTVVHRQEPIRKSLFDVTKFNLSTAGRTTFLHRFIYIGRHTFPEDEIRNHFEKNIKELHSKYYDEKLTGILLYYSAYFCHIIEGSEDTLFKHIHMLVDNETTAEYISDMKVLVFYRHINQRFLENWIALTAKPQMLFEKIDKDCDQEKSIQKIKACITKLYNLGIALQRQYKAKNVEDGEEEEEEESDEDLAPELSTMVTPDCLPESALLDFLIGTEYTYSIDHFTETYGIVPKIVTHKDPIWPIPTDFIPLHLFDKASDPIPEIKLPDTV